MNEHGPNPGLTGVCHNLLASLNQEAETLDRLGALFDRQLEALRGNDAETLEQATIAVNEEIHALEQHRQARLRQARLLGRMLRQPETEALEPLGQTLAARPDTAAQGQALLDARETVRRQAEHTRRRCDAFEFALQYAVRLGREMMQVIQDLDVPPPPRVYTARGQSSASPSSSSFINQVG